VYESTTESLPFESELTIGDLGPLLGVSATGGLGPLPGVRVHHWGSRLLRFESITGDPGIPLDVLAIGKITILLANKGP
jgi:hypothetical protein